MAIEFFYEDTDFSLSGKIGIGGFISGLIESEGKSLGEVNYIFCSDEYLLKINKEYLEHDYFTDIITFDYCEGNQISGDIFISIDRVRENAREYDVGFNNELVRVIFHGLLHLVGYNDKHNDEVELMRQKEDFYLDYFNI